MAFRHTFLCDAELLSRWQGGDGHAGDEIARRHRKTVLRVALHAYHMDPDLAEDAAQETFLRLQRSLPGYLARAPFPAYLRSIACHVCLDMRDEGPNRHRDREDPLEAQALEIPDPQQDLEALTVLNADLRDCLRRLTERSRKVFLLKSLGSVSYREIASQMGIPEGTVGRLVSESRQALANCLDGGAKKAPPVPA